MADDEVDALGRPKLSNDHNVLTVSQDAQRDGSIVPVAPADQDKTMTQMRAEALLERDNFTRDYPHEEGNLPQFDEGDPLRYRDAILAMRSAKEGEKINDDLKKGIAAMIGLAAANGGMLPAGAGVFSSEELAKQNQQKFPINKELDAILAKAGLDKPLRVAGVTGGDDIPKDSVITLDKALPNLKAAELAKVAQKDSGRERSLSA